MYLKSTMLRERSTAHALHPLCRDKYLENKPQRAHMTGNHLEVMK